MRIYGGIENKHIIVGYFAPRFMEKGRKLVPVCKTGVEVKKRN